MHDDLIARLEAATGPCRELDCLIQLAVVGDKTLRAGCAWGPGYHYQNGDKLSDVAPTFSAATWFGVPTFTASIDAALTLVPEGLVRRFEDHVCLTMCEAILFDAEKRIALGASEDNCWTGRAPTPALAIVIAALCALEARKP